MTGGSAGMGVAFVEALAQHGARVISVARRFEDASETADRIRLVGCDVTDQRERETLVAKVLAEYGRIDILVNNAGMTSTVRTVDETLARFEAVVALNLVAPFALAQLVAPGMLERGSGSIVNVASIAGLVGIGRMPQAAYTASKHGVIGLTRELALQWARKGIRVNALAPAFFPTEMTAELFAAESGQRWLSDLTPLGRGGRLDELVGGLLYLADPANSYTTGIVLPVDGGWTAA